MPKMTITMGSKDCGVCTDKIKPLTKHVKWMIKPYHIMCFVDEIKWVMNKRKHYTDLPEILNEFIGKYKEEFVRESL